MRICVSLTTLSGTIYLEIYSVGVYILGVCNARATYFGSGAAHTRESTAWESTIWESKILGQRILDLELPTVWESTVWESTILGARILSGAAHIWKSTLWESTILAQRILDLDMHTPIREHTRDTGESTV